MARIAGVNLPVQKHVWIGLTSIYGIGRPRARKICDAAGVVSSTKIRDLTEAEVEKYRKATETEAERQARELDDAKKNAEQAAGLVARYEAAETAGLPLSMAKRLIGATPEELAADAAQLAQTLAAQPSGTPRADPSQGAGNTGSGRTTSVAEAMAELKASREKK